MRHVRASSGAFAPAVFTTRPGQRRALLSATFGDPVSVPAGGIVAVPGDYNGNGTPDLAVATNADPDIVDGGPGDDRADSDRRDRVIGVE